MEDEREGINICLHLVISTVVTASNRKSLCILDIQIEAETQNKADRDQVR